jgi:hypothetical protein
MHMLRRALTDARGHAPIETVHGVGYRFATARPDRGAARYHNDGRQAQPPPQVRVELCPGRPGAGADPCRRHPPAQPPAGSAADRPDRFRRNGRPARTVRAPGPPRRPALPRLQRYQVRPTPRRCRCASGSAPAGWCRASSPATTPSAPVAGRTAQPGARLPRRRPGRRPLSRRSARDRQHRLLSSPTRYRCTRSAGGISPAPWRSAP